MKKVNQSLLSLGEAKLAIQAATSIGYDTQALGLMALAVALIGINAALAHDLGPIWWLPIVGLGASLLISVATISLPEIDTGQNLTLALRREAIDEQTDDLLLANLARAIDENIESLRGKRVLVTRATTLIGVSFAVVVGAQLLPGLWESINELVG